MGRVANRSWRGGWKAGRIPDSRFTQLNYGVSANLSEYGSEITTWDEVCQQNRGLCSDSFAAQIHGLHQALDKAYDKESNRWGCYWGRMPLRHQGVRRRDALLPVHPVPTRKI